MKKLVRKMHSGVVPMYFNLDFVFKLNKRDWDGLQEVFNKLEAYEATNHTPEECAAAFEELAAYRAGDIWKIVCFMIARNNIIESVPKERVDVIALMTIKSMPDMLQMEECRKLLAAAEAALKEQEGQK